jgi:hypothetical protein
MRLVLVSQIRLFDDGGDVFMEEWPVKANYQGFVTARRATLVPNLSQPVEAASLLDAFHHW